MQTSFGKICQRNACVDWKIEDFTSLSENYNEGYQSPIFNCFDADWVIMLYANGMTRKIKGWISVLLRSVNRYSDAAKGINVTCSIKHGAKVAKSCTYKHNFEVGLSPGSARFLMRSELLDQMQFSASKDITLNIIISHHDEGPGSSDGSNSHENISIPDKLKPSVESLVRNLKDLYLNKTDCDFTVTVKSQVFTAHKVILRARSPVFAATFSHDMRENLTGVMEIHDIEPDVFNDFLLYLYSGDVESLSWKNVFELFEISDKYDVKDLKEECIEFMKINLNLDNICTVLLFAEKYTETKLLKVAKDFVSVHADKLLSNVTWETFSKENTVLAHEILKMIVLDNAKISKSEKNIH